MRPRESPRNEREDRAEEVLGVTDGEERKETRRNAVEAAQDLNGIGHALKRIY